MSREPTRKVWELQTQLYDQYGMPRIDLDAMKARLDELHSPTDEDNQKGRIAALRNYCICVHNRCKYTQEDEDKAAAEIKSGSKRKPISAGEAKPEHVHIELQLRDARTLSAVAKWLSCPTIEVPESWIVYVNENKDGESATFDDKCAYLCHQLCPDKTPYDYDEMICTFNYADMMSVYVKRQLRKGKGKASRAFQDEHINKIASGEETVKGFINTFGYAAYEQGKAKYDHAEQHYLRTTYQGVGFRLTYLVTGPSTVGKTPLAKLLACSLFPNIANPREVYFCTGDENSLLQGYMGQPVIIWDDWRAIDFIKIFGREKVFSGLFAVHPDPTEFNIKYGTTMLRHTVNIVTCTDDIDTFATELAGQYTDKFGMFHKGEENQILQAYKRIWGLSEVTEDEISIMFNMGYYSNSVGREYYKQYQTALRLQNKTAGIAEKYSPSLYSHLGRKMFPIVGEEYQKCLEREAQKITDPDLIDDADLPDVIATIEDIVAVESEERDLAFIDDCVRYEQEASDYVEAAYQAVDDCVSDLERLKAKAIELKQHIAEYKANPPPSVGSPLTYDPVFNWEQELKTVQEQELETKKKLEDAQELVKSFTPNRV